jgi:hypothetical protein
VWGVMRKGFDLSGVKCRVSLVIFCFWVHMIMLYVHSYTTVLSNLVCNITVLTGKLTKSLVLVASNGYFICACMRLLLSCVVPFSFSKAKCASRNRLYERIDSNV